MDNIAVIGLMFSYLFFCLCVVVVIIMHARRQPVRHVRIDPPEDDERLVMIANGDTESIDRYKEECIYKLSLIHNGGKLNQKDMWSIIKEHHNRRFEEWPEMKELKISLHWFRDTIAARQIGEPGQRVIQVHSSIHNPALATQYDDEFIPYVIVIDRTNRKASRELVSVWAMAELWERENALYPASREDDEPTPLKSITPMLGEIVDSGPLAV